MMHDAVDDRGGHVPRHRTFLSPPPELQVRYERHTAATSSCSRKTHSSTSRSHASIRLEPFIGFAHARPRPTTASLALRGKGRISRVHRAWPPSSEQCPVRGLYGYTSGLSFELTDTRAGIVIPLLPRIICGYWHSGSYQEPHGAGAFLPPMPFLSAIRVQYERSCRSDLVVTPYMFI